MADRGPVASLFVPEPMLAVFSLRARVQAMLDFEAALARAEADAGVIPALAAEAIVPQCRAQLFNFEALAEGTLASGDIAIPLVKALTERVARRHVEVARYVHWGATSQDAIDTGLVLQLRAALDFFESTLERLNDELARLASKHQHTLMLGRTLLQPAPPVTLGLKAAGWLSAMDRARQRLRELRPNVLVVQFGGASGTLAALGRRGFDVANRLAHELRLTLPDLPWHSQRDRVAETGAALGILAGSLGKLARDIALMMQGEVAEVTERHVLGHDDGATGVLLRRTPVGVATMLAAATSVPGHVATLLSALPQEHERGLGGWQAESETLPEICVLTASSLLRAVALVEGLEVDTQRMRKNLDASRGLVMAEPVALALAEPLGRAVAHQLVLRACRRAAERDRDLRDVLLQDQSVTAHLSEAELDRLLDPAGYLGVTEDWIGRVLAAHASRRTQKPAPER